MTRRPAGARRPAGRAVRPRARSADQERDREPKYEFGDSWRTYRERAEHLRRTYGWTVPQLPQAENWLPLGRGDDQEYDQPPDRPPRWRGEERDSDREDC